MSPGRDGARLHIALAGDFMDWHGARRHMIRNLEIKNSAPSPEMKLGGGRQSRRGFARTLVLALPAVATIGQTTSAQAASTSKKWRAAIIGATGQGDYGHGMDLIFNDRPEVDMVAVADPDAAGRAKAAKRCLAARQYGDFRELLEKEKPQLVCLASRWSNRRLEMGRAALAAGAHLFSEKPFTRTLAEADELISMADRAGLKIVVAHQMRLAPSIVRLKEELAGALGELLEIRAWGKQDDRAGGEDMLVLGSHLFDLARLFAGDPASCSSRVLQNGREVTERDARTVREQIGPVAGDEIQACFSFENGVNLTFTSRRRLQSAAGHWGLELIGSKASARILADAFPAIYLLQPSPWDQSGRSEQWRRWPADPGQNLSAEERGFGPANRRLVDDWLSAIAQNREPACSGRSATKSLEMIMAVYEAALTGARVKFPLANRSHPLIR